MNDLPQSGNGDSSSHVQPIPMSGTLGMAKEGESMPVSELPIQEIGQEIELPKEVVSAGVKTQPTTVTLPNPISRMGVQPTGPTTLLSTGATIALPLTQPQITQGLEQSVVDSWRWLAVWCIRRLKQFKFFNVTNPTNK